jgi:hypothetical protein
VPLSAVVTTCFERGLLCSGRHTKSSHSSRWTKDSQGQDGTRADALAWHRCAREGCRARLKEKCFAYSREGSNQKRPSRNGCDQHVGFGGTQEDAFTPRGQHGPKMRSCRIADLYWSNAKNEATNASHTFDFLLKKKGLQKAPCDPECKACQNVEKHTKVHNSRIGEPRRWCHRSRRQQQHILPHKEQLG